MGFAGGMNSLLRAVGPGQSLMQVQYSHFEHPDVKPSNIYVDAVSLALLNGSTIDYATELIGSAFRVAANPHATDGGCGCGVSWELKV